MSNTTTSMSEILQNIPEGLRETIQKLIDDTVKEEVDNKLAD